MKTLNELQVGDVCDILRTNDNKTRIKITRKTKYLTEYHHLSNPNITYSQDTHTAHYIICSQDLK